AASWPLGVDNSTCSTQPGAIGVDHSPWQIPMLECLVGLRQLRVRTHQKFHWAGTQRPPCLRHHSHRYSRLSRTSVSKFSPLTLELAADTPRPLFEHLF